MDWVLCCVFCVVFCVLWCVVWVVCSVLWVLGCGFWVTVAARALVLVDWGQKHMIGATPLRLSWMSWDQILANIRITVLVLALICMFLSMISGGALSIWDDFTHPQPI